MSVQTDNRAKRSLGGPVLMLGLLLGVVAAAVWANLWKSELRVADVRVNGNVIVTEKEILSLASIDKDQRLYSVDLQSAHKRILRNPFVKSASVNREAPDCISITVRERIPVAAVVMDKIAYLDAEGVVLPPVRSESIFDLPVLTGSFQADDLAPGKQVSRTDVREALEVLASAQQLDDGLYRRISEVHVEEGRDIVLYTSEYGVPVMFGRGEVAMKMAKFDGFWREFVLHSGAKELAYVDLRFEDQVVVRWNHSNETQTTKTAAGGKARKQTKS